MADEKKIFVFTGSDGNRYEVESTDPDSALIKMESYAKKSGGLQFQPENPSLFTPPGGRVPTPERPTIDPAALPSDPDPTTRNMVSRNALRFLPSALLGKPALGAANMGIGAGIDALTGEDHLKSPGVGEALSEILGAALPIGAGMAEKSSNAAIQKFGKLARENPNLFGGATGAITGAAGTVGTGSEAAPHALLGGTLGLISGKIGQKLQNLAKASPEAANPAALEIAEKLGYRPGNIEAERPVLQQTSNVMKSVAELSDELEKAGAIPALRQQAKQKATAARTTDLMQAGAEAKRSYADLQKAKSGVAERKLLNSQRFRDLQDEAAVLKAQRSKYQNADTPSAMALDKQLAENKTKRDLHELLMAKEKSSGYPELDKARANFRDANQRKKLLRAIAVKNKLQMRDADLDRIALGEVADDVSTNTGYDPRNMTADQKSAVKWLAQDHPEAIAETFMKDASSSTSRAKGLVSLFGPKSQEVSGVRNQLVSRLFNDSVQNSGPYAGRGISGEKFGEMLSKMSNDSLNIMFDNSEAASTLRGIEKLLVDAEFTRTPAKFLHMIITPSSLSRTNGENGIALATSTGIIQAYQTLPKFIDAMMSRDNPIGRAFRIYAKNPTPGTLLRLQTAAQTQKATDAKPEQTLPESP